MATGEGPGQRHSHAAGLAAVAYPGHRDEPSAPGDGQRGRRGGRLGDQPVGVLAQRPGGPDPGRVLSQHDQMRPGQPQPEPLATDQQIGGIAAGEQVVDELQPFRLLAAGDRQVGPLEALGRGRHRIVGGAQHTEPGRPQIGQPGQFPPQPPRRRQVQVDQAAQGHAALRGPLPRPAVLGQFHGGQAAAGTRRVRRGRQVAGQQVRGHPARLPAGRAGDRLQVDRFRGISSTSHPGNRPSPGRIHRPGRPSRHIASAGLALAHSSAPQLPEVAGSGQLRGRDLSRSGR